MREHQGYDLAECQRERTVLRNTFSRPFKDQSGARRNGTSFGLNDLEALVTVGHEAQEWIAAHVLKR
jgi:hypothetical protein